MLRRIEHAFAKATKGFARAARLAVGVPDYARYVEHVRNAHPGATPMNEAEFVRDRLRARYARGRSRCC